MKLSAIASTAACLAFVIAPVEVFANEGSEGRPATTRAQLIERVKNQSAVAVATPEEQRPRWDLAEHSEFISFSGDSTLIPKKAILHLPEKYREFVGSAAKGKLLPWGEFSSKYPAFISNIELNLDQISGKIPLDPKILESAAKNGRIAVAVLNGSPISAFPVAPPPAAPAP